MLSSPQTIKLNELIKRDLIKNYEMRIGLAEDLYIPQLSLKYKLDILKGAGILKEDIADPDDYFFDVMDEILIWKPQIDIKTDIKILKDYSKWLDNYRPNADEVIFQYYKVLFDYFISLGLKYYIPLPFRENTNWKTLVSKIEKTFVIQKAGRQKELTIRKIRWICETLFNKLRKFTFLENMFNRHLILSRFPIKETSDMLTNKTIAERINEDIFKIKLLTIWNNDYYYRHLYEVINPNKRLIGEITRERKEIWDMLNKKFNVKTNQLINRTGKNIRNNNWHLQFSKNQDDVEIFNIVHTLLAIDRKGGEDIDKYLLFKIEGLFNSKIKMPFPTNSYIVLKELKNKIEKIKEGDIENIMTLQNFVNKFGEQKPIKRVVSNWQLLDIGFYTHLLKKFGNTCMIIDESKDNIEKQRSMVFDAGLNKGAQLISVPFNFKTFMEKVIECGKKGKLVLIPLIFRAQAEDTKDKSGWAHANMLIYNPFLNIVEHYEPHGESFRSFRVDSNFNENLINNIEDFFAIYDIEYYPPSKTCPRQSLQHYEVDRSGQCLVWAWYIAYLRLTNPSAEPKKLLTDAIQIATIKTNKLEDIVIDFKNKIILEIRQQQKIIANKLNKKIEDITTKETLKGLYDNLKLLSSELEKKEKTLQITLSKILRDKVVNLAININNENQGTINMGLLKEFIVKPGMDLKGLKEKRTKGEINTKAKPTQNAIKILQKYFRVLGYINNIKTANVNINSTDVGFINIDIDKDGYKTTKVNKGNVDTMANIGKINNTSFI